MVDARFGAELIEDRLAAGRMLLAPQPVGECLVVVGEELTDAEIAPLPERPSGTLLWLMPTWWF